MNCLKKSAARLLLTAAVAIPALTGCVNDSSLCPDVPEGGVQASFQFTVVTRGAVHSASRAANLDPVGDQSASDAENALDLDRTQFLIFDRDKKLLEALYPNIVEDNMPLYTATVTLTLPYFADAVAANADNIPFYIMVLSNCRGIVAEKGQTIDQIAAELQTFSAPQNINATTGWSPSIEDNRLIPMSGSQGFSVSAAQLLASTPENPVRLSDGGKNVDMLRALVKIEIIDGITDGNYSLTGATLDGHFTSGTILPAIAQWKDYASVDVKAPTMPENPVFDTANALIFTKDTAEPDLADAKAVYSVYVPEFLLGANGATAATVNARLKPAVGDEITRSFTVADYSGNFPNELEQLRRNHIYRFEVTGVSVDMNLQLNYTVCPMDDVTSGDITFE